MKYRLESRSWEQAGAMSQPSQVKGDSSLGQNSARGQGALGRFETCFEGEATGCTGENLETFRQGLWNNERGWMLARLGKL